MPRRLLPLTALALVALASAPGAASATELFAAQAGGSGPDCAVAAAPCSVSAALLAARAAPGADVIHLAAGTYTTPVSATNAADTDVTLDGAGIAATIIAAAPPADAPMVELGAGGGTMALEDLTLDGTGAGTFASPLRSRLAALSLRRVRIVQTGVTPKQAPAIDADMAAQALTLDGVEVLADTQTADQAVAAVNAGGPAIVRDSTITHTATGLSAALYARGPLTVLRSTIVHGNADAGYALRVSNQTDALNIVVDSSVVQGGRSAARFDLGTAASKLALRGTTFATAAASTGWSVDVQPNAAASAVQGTIDSSLLVGRSARATNGATVACAFSNLTLSGNAVNCPTTAGNAAGNTKLTTAELQLGADLAPLPGSPAIDAGNPAGLGPGESPADRLGRLRTAASTNACDAGPGRRDKGAFERYRPTPQIAITGPDAVAPGAPATFTVVTSAPGLELHWTFADGADGGTAATATHAFSALPSAATLTARDPRWDCSASASRPIAAAALPPETGAGPGAGTPAPSLDRIAPSIRSARLDAARIRLRRGSIRLRLTLSEAATITLTVGRAKGKKLVAPRRLVVRGVEGKNTITLFARKLKLRRGRYAVRIAARDAAGNAARTQTLKFSAR